VELNEPKNWIDSIDFSDDAEAIAEAVERKNMRFLPIKTDDQLDLQALHQVRERLMIRRTSVVNQIRSFLLERRSVCEEADPSEGGHPRGA
jgi:transposase